MADRFDKLAFETAQAARIGWFFGQKLLAARLARPVPRPSELRGRTMPDRQPPPRRSVAADRAGLAQHRRRASTRCPRIGAATRSPGCAGRSISSPISARSRRAATATRRERLLPRPEAGRYPAYYRRKFHFQSDGYLSAASAERYDHQVEVLFGGGAAAMRRQALVPLREALAERPGGARSAKLLDIGCGTGALSARGQAQLPAPRGHRARPVGALSGGGAAAAMPRGRGSRSSEGNAEGAAVRRRQLRHRHLPLSVPRAAAPRAPGRRRRNRSRVEAGRTLIFCRLAADRRRARLRRDARLVPRCLSRALLRELSARGFRPAVQRRTSA